MTLRMEQVARELSGLVDRYLQQLEGMEAGLAEAAGALRRWSESPEDGDRLIARAMANNPRPYAVAFREPPDAVFEPPPLAPVTVVAADGSSIEPDRFAAVPCYVVNVGFAVLPYLVAGEAVLGSDALLGPEAAFSDEGEDHGFDDVGPAGWAVNLRRDVRELEVGARLAVDRLAAGPVVLLLDGTLFPWDLDSRQVPEPVRGELRGRTQDALDLLAVQKGRPGVGAYISGSRAADVVTSLRTLARDTAVWPGGDGRLFCARLGEGQRSALFRAQSERVGRVESMFTAPHQVCFFYLRIGDDVARVEVPHWAAGADQIGRLHATIVDQCRRCGGYPRALQEAHEQAVISSGDRLQFSRVLDTEAFRHGLRVAANNKQMSKRRRAV